MMKLGRVLRGVVNGVFVLMLIVGICLIGLRALGYQLLAVRTGSMQSSYPVGSLVLVAPVIPRELEPGDVVSFLADSSLSIVTHRVVRNDTSRETLETKGDENNAIDQTPVQYRNVLGKVVGDVPYAGYLVLWLQTRSGKLCVALGISGVIAVEIVGWLRQLQKRKRRRGNAQDHREHHKS